MDRPPFNLTELVTSHVWEDTEIDPALCIWGWPECWSLDHRRPPEISTRLGQAMCFAGSYSVEEVKKLLISLPHFIDVWQ